jgi:hypothetical protein
MASTLVTSHKRAITRDQNIPVSYSLISMLVEQYCYFVSDSQFRFYNSELMIIRPL